MANEEKRVGGFPPKLFRYDLCLIIRVTGLDLSSYSAVYDDAMPFPA